MRKFVILFFISIFLLLSIPSQSSNFYSFVLIFLFVICITFPGSDSGLENSLDLTKQWRWSDWKITFSFSFLPRINLRMRYRRRGKSVGLKIVQLWVKVRNENVGRFCVLWHNCETETALEKLERDKKMINFEFSVNLIIHSHLHIIFRCHQRASALISSCTCGPNCFIFIRIIEFSSTTHSTALSQLNSQYQQNYILLNETRWSLIKIPQMCVRVVSRKQIEQIV